MNEPESPGSEEAEEKKPKPRKSFMDDDDDSYTGKGAVAAAPTNGVETDRGRRDREAAELVRKAAEEDGKFYW